ncbi:hypothetical protein [Kitasatospora sp. McL0602]|uniref:hypothetical protein n=1 Tax=Kitasatospora sp. McL0602 TaxID=3439530 RepID=UPI003F886B1A
MQELRTDQLKPGMTVKLKSRAGTLPHNDWYTVQAIDELPRKQYVPLGAGHDGTFRRPFAARTLWLLQAETTSPVWGPTRTNHANHHAFRDTRAICRNDIRPIHPDYALRTQADIAQLPYQVTFCGSCTQHLAAAERHQAAAQLRADEAAAARTAAPAVNYMSYLVRALAAQNPCRHGNTPLPGATGAPVSACTSKDLTTEFGAFSGSGCFYTDDCAVLVANEAARENEAANAPQAEPVAVWERICPDHEGERAKSCPECTTEEQQALAAVLTGFSMDDAARLAAPLIDGSAHVEHINDGVTRLDTSQHHTLVADFEGGLWTVATWSCPTARACTDPEHQSAPKEAVEDHLDLSEGTHTLDQAAHAIAHATTGNLRPDTHPRPAPVRRTLKGIKSGTTITIWLVPRTVSWSSVPVLGPVHDARRPIGDPYEVTVTTSGQSWSGVAADGTEVILGGTATKHWLVPA